MPLLLRAVVARRVHPGFETANPRYTLPLADPPSHPAPCAWTGNESPPYSYGQTSNLAAIDGIVQSSRMKLLAQLCPSLNLIFPLSQPRLLNLIPPNICKSPKLGHN
ncbi:hypothetical protein AMTRI_Chr02g223960 [Amborella trichopoda]